MTIAHSGSTQGADNTTPVAHTTPAIGAQRINLALLNVNRSPPGDVPNPPTYGGVAMTLLTSVTYDFVGFPGRLYAYYQVAPLTGPNNLALTWAAGPTAGNNYCMAISSYLYVDQVTPFFGVPVTGSGRAASGSIIVPSQVDQLVVDWLAIQSTGSGPNTPVQGAGQSLRNVNASAVGGGSVGDGMSDEQGALSVTMSWTWANADVIWGMIGTALRPAVDPRTRAVKYFFNIWDPTHTIKDGIGNITPNEVRADNWVETDGFTLGESQTYPDFIRDPTKSRIVSITYRRSGVDIKTSKSQFADVIVARAAAGRM